MKLAQSPLPIAAYQAVTSLQTYFADKLSEITTLAGKPQVFTQLSWLRNQGLWGGGTRLVSANNHIFNSAAINCSQVHYEQEPNIPLNSATAISTIIHPQSPHSPSVHMHFSFTEFKQQASFWRLMVDLNPAIFNQSDKDKFITAIKSVAGDTFVEGIKQGEMYFTIPILQRTRGSIHYYLEQSQSADLDFAHDFAKTMMDCYLEVLLNSLSRKSTETEQQTQIDYHTLYLLQVLTLDRGTTSGLLVHNENDLGIMGSIPRLINRNLLKSWAQFDNTWFNLINQIISVLPNTSIVTIDNAVKQKLANVVRGFFTANPQMLDLQAKGFIVPPTVNNHLRAEIDQL